MYNNCKVQRIHFSFLIDGVQTLEFLFLTGCKECNCKEFVHFVSEITKDLKHLKEVYKGLLNICMYVIYLVLNNVSSDTI